MNAWVMQIDARTAILRILRKKNKILEHIKTIPLNSLFCFDINLVLNSQGYVHNYPINN